MPIGFSESPPFPSDGRVAEGPAAPAQKGNEAHGSTPAHAAAGPGHSRPSSSGELMSPAQHDSDGNGLTVLTVREGEACIRDFRFDCRGETSCRAELGELLQLLERRHADIAIFLAHPNLVGALIEELRRRGSDIPEMVIAPPTDAADARVTVSVSLSGLSESAYPQELLARLYEALRSSQDGSRAQTPVGTGDDVAPHVGHEEPAGPQSSVSEEAAGAGTDLSGPEQQAIDTQTGATVQSPLTETLGDSLGQAGVADDGAEKAQTDERDVQAQTEIEELSARLERILDQRLQQS